MEKKPERSCGILAYKLDEDRRRMKVLLGRCGGYSGSKESPWNIPKGHVEGDENDMDCACREFSEETGLVICGSPEMVDLGTSKTSSGKIVHIFATRMDFSKGSDIVEIHSNMCKMEMPRKSGNFIEVPELIEAKYMDADDALHQMFPYQRIFVKRLLIYYYQNLIQETARCLGVEPSLAKELNAMHYEFEVNEKFDPYKGF